MAWSISDLFPPWGDNGERPSDNFNYQGGDQVNEKHLDYLWYSVGELEDEVRSALEDLESDGDGFVDGADAANGDFELDGDLIAPDGEIIWDESQNFINVDRLQIKDGEAQEIDVDEFSRDNASDGQFLRDDGWATPAFGASLADGSGVVDEGDAANIFTDDLDDGETLEVTEAALIQSDGEPAPSGVDLIIASLDNAGGGTSQVDILQGDGTFVKGGQEGSPLASYTNNSGGVQTVMIAIDNGHFNAGSGSSADMFARAGVQTN